MTDHDDRAHGDQAAGARSRLSVRVEYPGEGETIARKPYTFHIAASPGTVGVEVSVDRGDWMPCREALGLWWRDWIAAGQGDHEIVARARGGGISADSAPRRFSVE
jgi:hypothetical protein